MPESDTEKLLFIMQAVLVAQKYGLSARIKRNMACLDGW
jgi:hypothetical protein